ncbi:MAG TPA: class I SAM-dependent methyltransferase, partial [Candidatus Dormibacteraeota bacterium]|nr:class I SAM-dependent methyltransferase [Candidatus Dormibacteraeota bacterium]
DPRHPDPGFAELYASLPDANDLWPWLELAQAAAPPVLYLGIGAGRLAVPLVNAGVALVGVDSHPRMLERVAQRLPGTELILQRLEQLDLGRRFDLVMVPSNILFTQERLRGAAGQLAAGGRLAFELANPHWLRSGEHDGVRVTRFDGNGARLEIDYQVLDRTYTQVADISLIWPEEIDSWLSGAKLLLERIFGQKDAELESSPTYYVVASLIA